MKTITRIEAKVRNARTKKLKVAAYARVSTSSEEQLLSLEAQKSHYEQFIKKHPNWEYIGLFYDEGISGTKIDKREGLRNLLKACENAEIDFVITKSISRFSRNTLDCLNMVRKLMNIGVHIFFEKENIDTSRMNSELLLTIMSSIAEGESKSISDNIHWSIKNRFQSGTFIISAPPYGYANMDGTLKIIESEAKIVKYIFQESIKGVGSYTIANYLNREKIPSKKGGRWHSETILQILRNEKYTGDVLFQKTYIDSYYRKKINKGEKDSYYMENHHEPIITHEEFELAQKSIEERKNRMNIESDNDKYLKSYSFTGCLYCEKCGARLKRASYQNKNGKMIIWVCTKHIKSKQLCTLKSISEVDLQFAFLNLMNKLQFSREFLLRPFIAALESKKNERKIETILSIQNQLEQVRVKKARIHQLFHAQYLNGENFLPEKIALENEEQALLNEIEKVDAELTDGIKDYREAICLDKILNKKSKFIEFDSLLFHQVVHHVVVNDRQKFTFFLRCGLRLMEGVKSK